MTFIRSQVLARILWGVGIVLALQSTAALAVECRPSTAWNGAPTGRYTDNGDGTVTDKATNLTWKRCVEGQAWTGTSCSGIATTYGWSSALALNGGGNFAGYSDWRLPNIKELASLATRHCKSPALNATAFPSPATSSHWTATPVYSNAALAWYFDVSAAIPRRGTKTDTYKVRLVRGN